MNISIPYIRKSLYIYVSATIISGCSLNLVEHNTATKTKPTLANISEDNLKIYTEALYALRNNKLEKSENKLNELIKIIPNIAGAQANLGLIYFKRNDYKKASTYFEKAIKLNPKNYKIHNAIANNYIRLGEFSLAEKHFLEATKLKPTDSRSHYNLALLYDIYFHEIDKSVKHYSRYLKILEKKGVEDKLTIDWVKQLKSSINKG